MAIAVFGSFLLDWLAVGCDWRRIKPLTKVMAMVMVILWTLSFADWTPEGLMMLLILAQIFGLAGDIFLLFSAKWFFAGLGAFLLGHLFYIALVLTNLIASIVNSDLQLLNLILPLIIAVILWAAVLWFVYHKFQRGYFIKRHQGRLLWALVQVYIWILSGMMILTVFRFLIQPDPILQMALLPIGGMLFLLSDTILAYNRFIKPVPHGHLRVHISYHLAQFALAAGFLSILGIV